MSQTPADIAAASNLIAHNEGFEPRAAWDVNAYRLGFGSDTEGPEQTPVRKGMETTRERALANLAIRVPAFMDVVEGQVGAELYAKLGCNTKAALADMAYNYGRVPANVISAILSNSQNVSAAIRTCGSDNGGINRWRRDGEAAVVALDGGQY